MIERPASLTQGPESDPDEDPEDILVARLSSGRRSGDEGTKDVEALLRRAAEHNRAALDRLAQ